MSCKDIFPYAVSPLHLLSVSLEKKTRKTACVVMFIEQFVSLTPYFAPLVPSSDSSLTPLSLNFPSAACVWSHTLPHPHHTTHRLTSRQLETKHMVAQVPASSLHTTPPHPSTPPLRIPPHHPSPSLHTTPLYPSTTTLPPFLFILSYRMSGNSLKCICNYHWFPLWSVSSRMANC